MRRIGFTLVELLVVISIIALLMAILVPALGHSRRQARSIVCRSNIRQLVFGLNMYENDNEAFPHAVDETIMKLLSGRPRGNPMFDRMGWWWFDRLPSHSKKDPDKSSIFICPSRKISTGRLRNNVLYGNYGVNRSICKTSIGTPSRAKFTGRPLNSFDILRHGKTLLVVDSGYSMITWWHAADVPPQPLGSEFEDTAYIPGLEINAGKKLKSGQDEDAIKGRHPDRTVNVGFVDGHADRKKAEDLLVRGSGAIYQNRHPLWLPK